MAVQFQVGWTRGWYPTVKEIKLLAEERSEGFEVSEGHVVRNLAKISSHPELDVGIKEEYSLRAQRAYGATQEHKDYFNYVISTPYYSSRGEPDYSKRELALYWVDIKDTCRERMLDDVVNSMSMLSKLTYSGGDGVILPAGFSMDRKMDKRGRRQCWSELFFVIVDGLAIDRDVERGAQLLLDRVFTHHHATKLRSKTSRYNSYTQEPVRQVLFNNGMLRMYGGRMLSYPNLSLFLSFLRDFTEIVGRIGRGETEASVDTIVKAYLNLALYKESGNSWNMKKYFYMAVYTAWALTRKRGDIDRRKPAMAISTEEPLFQGANTLGLSSSLVYSGPSTWTEYSLFPTSYFSEEKMYELFYLPYEKEANHFLRAYRRYIKLNTVGGLIGSSLPQNIFLLISRLKVYKSLKDGKRVYRDDVIDCFVPPNKKENNNLKYRGKKGGKN